jgi:DNA-directed RNA polymerase subunit H (RpoH/RPB5)
MLIQLNPFALLARLAVANKSSRGPQAAVTAMAAAAEAAQPSTTAKAEESVMGFGTVVLDVEKGIEVGAADVLKVLTVAEKDLPKVTAAEPKVAAALGVLLGQVGVAVSAAESGATAGGVNIVLDTATLNALKTVWPDTKAFLATLGVKV